MIGPRTLSPRTELRMVAAFALMPLAAGVLMAGLCLALWGTGYDIFEGGRPRDPMPAAVSLGMGAAVIAVVVTVFGAVPAVAWLAGRGPLSLRRLLVLGAALGNAPFAIIVLGVLGTQLAKGTLTRGVGGAWFGTPGAVRAIVVGLILGMSSAALFWFIAVRGTDLDSRAV
jgi:hypothetical protein